MLYQRNSILWTPFLVSGGIGLPFCCISRLNRHTSTFLLAIHSFLCSDELPILPIFSPRLSLKTPWKTPPSASTHLTEPRDSPRVLPQKEIKSTPKSIVLQTPSPFKANNAFYSAIIQELHHNDPPEDVLSLLRKLELPSIAAI